MIDKLILLLINIIHYIVILSVLFIPFTNNSFLLLLHSIIIPFILFHWYLNNDTCALTLIEKFVRQKINNKINVKEEDCLTYKIISPIYNFTNYNKSKIIWIITILLWLVSSIKVYNKYSNNEYDKVINEFKNIISF